MRGMIIEVRRTLLHLDKSLANENTGWADKGKDLLFGRRRS